VTAYEKLQKLDDGQFKLITGVTRATFDQMQEVLLARYEYEHRMGGRPGLPVELRLTLALEYWREYRALRHMANDHQISKSALSSAILWVEDVLSESEEFSLPELKEHFKPSENGELQVVLIDVGEQPIERPKYDQEKSYSGKKRDTPQNTRS
jgi:hypothetical protein